MWEVLELHVNTAIHTTYNPRRNSMVQKFPDELQATDIRGGKECRNVRSHGVAGHRAYINVIADTQTSQYFSYKATAYPNGYRLKVVSFNTHVNILRDTFQLNDWPVCT
jgi:hypothetical protein